MTDAHRGEQYFALVCVGVNGSEQHWQRSVSSSKFRFSLGLSFHRKNRALCAAQQNRAVGELD
jgi:hypothetical protein